MLTITIPQRELFDEGTNEFLSIKETVVDLEHSLVSLSKWESKFKKPFLGKDNKTREETIGYVEAMCLTPNIDPKTFLFLSDDNVNDINRYIEDDQTATTVYEPPAKPNARPETITSELIYYWMFTLTIPIECETWHLSRLFMLIRVFNVKNNPQPKMSRNEMIAQRRALNEQRMAKHNTSG